MRKRSLLLGLGLAGVTALAGTGWIAWSGAGSAPAAAAVVESPVEFVGTVFPGTVTIYEGTGDDLVVVNARDITPPGVTRITVNGPLRRVDPPPQEPRAALPEHERFTAMIALDGTTLRTVLGGEEVLIALAGIHGPAFSDRCLDASGTEWRCGGAAQAALADMVRGETVTCSLGERGPTGAVSGTCEVRGRDLAERLVEDGWAEPTDASSPLSITLGQAQSAGRGRWGAAALTVAAVPSGLSEVSRQGLGYQGTGLVNAVE